MADRCTIERLDDECAQPRTHNAGDRTRDPAPYSHRAATGDPLTDPTTDGTSAPEDDVFVHPGSVLLHHHSSRPKVTTTCHTMPHSETSPQQKLDSSRFSLSGVESLSSPSPLPRDSGYTTEASPSNTCSPANTATPPSRHFLFSESEQDCETIDPAVEEGGGEASSLPRADLYNLDITNQDQKEMSLYERRNQRLMRRTGGVSPLRLSPGIFNQQRNIESAASRRLFNEEDHIDGARRPRHDSTSDEDDASTSTETNQSTSSVQGAHERQQQLYRESLRSASHFDTSGNFIGRQSSSNDSGDTGDEEDEEVFYSEYGSDCRFGHQSSRVRTGSFSTRARRFCSDGDDEDEPQGSTRVLIRRTSEARMSTPGRPGGLNIFGGLTSVSTSPRRRRVSQSTSHDAIPGLQQSPSPNHLSQRVRMNPDLNTSQGFEPSSLQPIDNQASHNNRSNFHEDVFNFDLDDLDIGAGAPSPRRSLSRLAQQQRSPGGARPKTFTAPRQPGASVSSPHLLVRHISGSAPQTSRWERLPVGSVSHSSLWERLPVGPASHSSLWERLPANPGLSFTTQRTTMPVHTSGPGGLRLDGMGGHMTVSQGTQTPHEVSYMIREIMDFPVPLPYAARGTVASRLRRMSESGAVAPPSPMPLPDIVPIGRDRSLSAPDARALARQRQRRTGREVGRELRRLSDEFNMSFRGNLSPVDEEDHAHMLAGQDHAYIDGIFGSFIRAFGISRRRRSSSVDLGEEDPRP